MLLERKFAFCFEMIGLHLFLHLQVLPVDEHEVGEVPLHLLHGPRLGHPLAPGNVVGGDHQVLLLDA